MEPGTRYCSTCGLIRLPQYAMECPQCNEPLSTFTGPPKNEPAIVTEKETVLRRLDELVEEKVEAKPAPKRSRKAKKGPVPEPINYARETLEKRREWR